MRNKYKLIYLEGLPGVGKTTIVKTLREQYPNITIVDEIINEKIFNNINLFQEMYFDNDDMKYASCKNVSVVDRGPISTLSYNQARKIIDKDFLFSFVDLYNWFEKYKEIYSSGDVLVIYLKRSNSNYFIPYDNKLDPYGCVENQNSGDQGYSPIWGCHWLLNIKVLSGAKPQKGLQTSYEEQVSV